MKLFTAAALSQRVRSIPFKGYARDITGYLDCGVEVSGLRLVSGLGLVAGFVLRVSVVGHGETTKGSMQHKWANEACKDMAGICKYMCCPQNCRPLLVKDCFMAPYIYVYQNLALI